MLASTETELRSRRSELSEVSAASQLVLHGEGSRFPYPQGQGLLYEPWAQGFPEHRHSHESCSLVTPQVNSQILAKTAEYDSLVATTAGKAAELREKQAQLEVAREQVGIGNPRVGGEGRGTVLAEALSCFEGRQCG